MELRPAEETIQEIVRRYDKNPKGWQFLVGRGAGGYQDLFFIQQPDNQIWQIKQHYLNPYKIVGFGGSIDAPPPSLESPEFGLRPVPQAELAQIFHERPSMVVLEKILRRSPVPMREAMHDEGLLSGPIIHLRQSPSFLSKEQEKLDLKLRLELEDFLWKRYPERMRLSI
jgi:hypothetical protein